MSLHGAAAVLTAILIALPLSGSTQRAAQRDRDELEAVERLWLRSEHDRATLERILADDFVSDGGAVIEHVSRRGSETAAPGLGDFVMPVKEIASWRIVRHAA
jgi:hypothetical protein